MPHRRDPSETRRQEQHPDHAEMDQTTGTPHTTRQGRLLQTSRHLARVSMRRVQGEQWCHDDTNRSHRCIGHAGRTLPARVVSCELLGRRNAPDSGRPPRQAEHIPELRLDQPGTVRRPGVSPCSSRTTPCGRGSRPGAGSPSPVRRRTRDLRGRASSRSRRHPDDSR